MEDCDFVKTVGLFGYFSAGNNIVSYPISSFSTPLFAVNTYTSALFGRLFNVVMPLCSSIYYYGKVLLIF